MKVVDLMGNQQEWHLTGNIAKGKMSNKSSFHLKAREMIRETHPTLQILEEVSIQLRRSEVLFLDFYLPLIKLCVEIHGEQHYKFTPFYHSSRFAFMKAQKRDREKQEWCEINNITYLSLEFNEIDSWKAKLQYV